MNNISLNIQNLKSLSQKIEGEIGVQINNLHGRTFTANEAKRSHQHIKNIYDNAIVEIANLKNDIEQKTNYSNQEAMFTTVTQVTEIENTLAKAFTYFTDTLLTSYATAKIEYGDACIGPKVHPSTRASKIIRDEKDIIIQENLNKCSSIREIRGDGNCFTSAIIARFLEMHMENNTLADFINFTFDDGIDDVDVKQEIGDILLQLISKDLNLEKTLQNNTKILPFIKYFRLLAADEMKKKPTDFESPLRFEIEDSFNQIQEGILYDDLIDKYVLTMGSDFSHSMISALCERLKLPIKIIDPKGLRKEVDFCTDQNKATQTILLRIDLHYILLYQNNSITSPANIMPINIISTNLTTLQKPTELVFYCKITSGNTLFIRGDEIAGLSWKQGIPLIEKGNIWIFKSSKSLNDGEYKILFNDKIWENLQGNRKFSNRSLNCTAPEFNLPTNLEILEETPSITMPITPIEIKEVLPKISMIQFRIFTKNNDDKPYARGDGPGMENWTKGVELYSNYNGTWSLRYLEGSEFNYKILMNDNLKQYENFPGNRHTRDKDGIKDVNFLY